MPPKLNGFDHVHIYVADRVKAANWYQDVLGFRPSAEFAVWAEDEQGPLIIEDEAGKIHLAIFQGQNFTPSSAVAFNASGAQFIAWKEYLEAKGIVSRCSDHSLSWSLYFKDLDSNQHEITSYDYDYIARHL